ncbi:MAG: S41 family peptidase [Oscillospiraceae bacterium]|nr:S41 family peptidase [Oscillospiraceae bacterium]
MNRKISLGAAITLAIMFSTVTFIITMIYSRNAFDSMVFNITERETMYAKLSEVDRLVRQRYYNRIDEDTLGQELIKGYMTGIEDKYGAYMTAEQYSELQSGYQGKTVDIGLVISQHSEGYILIDGVYDDSPASLSELMPGDLIVKVDDINVSLETYEEAVLALKGDPGTAVTLTIRRENVDTPYTITRRKVNVPSVYGEMIEGNIAKLKITEFNDNTPDQFFKIFTQLRTEGASGFIFDLRNNSGGTVESVCRILDTLLPEGPIVSALYKGATEPEVLFSSDEDSVDAPMVVVINSKTASAAELFAQALRDYNKARVVGTTSYGKGSMQEIHKLSDGSAIDITVALYTPPFSENFEGVGVKPDFDVHISPDMEKILDELDHNSDPQLKKAVEVVSAEIRNIENPAQPVTPDQPVTSNSSSEAPSSSQPSDEPEQSEEQSEEEGEQSEDETKEPEDSSVEEIESPEEGIVH